MFAYIILPISLFLFVQSLLSVYLMLYSWQNKDTIAASRGPRRFLAPELSFAVLLPAWHEEAVIYETVKRVCQANYPTDLLEVVVICHIDDKRTIAEAQRAFRDVRSQRARIITFADKPVNKPHALNLGLRGTHHDVVTVFDAEDDIHGDIFHIINTTMLQEQVRIVQGGVQLMNYRDHWFAIHNCVEYYFWFKSRLHFHARKGMIPLGGNTIFIHRDLLRKIGGWDEKCLTEDADIGVRLSVLGEPVRVIYDRMYVTREETPPTVTSFIRQRTRWQQGFLQVLGKGDWLALPRFDQKLLALYTLTYPFTQAILTLFWLPAIVAIIWLKLAVLIAIITFLPLYSLLFQYIATVIGAYIFSRDYRLKFPRSLPFTMALTFLPFQWIQGISSLRVVYRVLFRRNNWEKTVHAGAHRSSRLLLLDPYEEEQDAAIDAILQQSITPLPDSSSSADAASSVRGALEPATPYAAILRKTGPIVLEEQDMKMLDDDDDATQLYPAYRRGPYRQNIPGDGQTRHPEANPAEATPEQQKKNEADEKKKDTVLQEEGEQ